MNKKIATARAPANVALVKYFGKRDVDLNLPAAGSLSLTLAPLETMTEVQTDPSLGADEIFMDGEIADPSFSMRVSGFLDLVREMAGAGIYARVRTENNFPTAAGLASSASGFAALAVAGAGAYDLSLDEQHLSALARRGSGSAARSIPGGIVVWEEGERQDGLDSTARSIADPGDWDLRLIAGVTDPGPKKIGSTEAMERTRKTSPHYAGWIESTRVDLGEAITAVNDQNLEKLGEITERSALAMHGAALAARPAILFWNGVTVEALHLVRELRAKGYQAWFTCDAGPQPKILCSPHDEKSIVEALSQLPGITDIIRCKLTSGARVI